MLGGVWGQQEGTVERGCTHDKVGTWLGGAIVLVISLFPRVTTQGGKRARNILKTHLVGSRASTVSSLLPSGMMPNLYLPRESVQGGRGMQLRVTRHHRACYVLHNVVSCIVFCFKAAVGTTISKTTSKACRHEIYVTVC